MTNFAGILRREYTIKEIEGTRKVIENVAWK